MSGRRAIRTAAIGFALISASAVHAALITSEAEVLYDLTSGGSVTINGAVYTTNIQQPTGSGVIHSFVRVSAANQGIVQGYNTDGRPLQFDENNSLTFTRHQKLADMQIVSLNDIEYYQFLLDINQRSSEPLLTLNEVEIYQGDAPNLLGYSPNRSEGGTGFGVHSDFVFDQDEGADAAVDLNYNLNSGSGSGDMYLYVPKEYFTSTKPYVYLYSKFGVPHPNNDGYEEWAAIEGPNPVVPEPSSLAGAALLVGLLIRRRK